MNSISYINPAPLNKIVFKLEEKPEKEPGENEVLVKIKAIALNPVDVKIRMAKAGTNEKPIVLGWDASGIIKKVGHSVKNFRTGDEVFYSGDLTKEGSYSDSQFVDYRLIAHKPKTIDFEDAAALPLTSLTAYEMIFEKMKINSESKKVVLIIGGAGGVGSQAIQLLKAKTQCTIIATASRAESIQWVKKLGVDYVVSHEKFDTEIRALGFQYADAIFCTGHTDQHYEKIESIISPFGDLGIIDEPKNIDLMRLKKKSISIHFEFMFTKSMFDFHPESQGKILSEIGQLIDTGNIQTTKQVVLSELTIENIKKGHEILESNKSIGKIVICCV